MTTAAAVPAPAGPALVERLPLGPGTAQWPLWSTTARLVVTDPTRLADARAVVVEHLAAVELACSRFRPDSEIQRLGHSGGGWVTVSPLLTELVEVALDAARRTGGDVDPTVGRALVDLGYSGDLPAAGAGTLEAPATGPSRSGTWIRVAAVPGWRSVQQQGRRIRVPDGVLLDLGATAKAHAADGAARLAAEATGAGVLLALGGDIATAGPAPDGWRVLVQDRPGDPACTISIPAGAAVATSSTQVRTWLHEGETMHHVIDPRTGLPARAQWRTVSAVARSCARANTWTTAALVRGAAALPWLRSARVPARLVDQELTIRTLGGWPREAGG